MHANYLDINLVNKNRRKRKRKYRNDKKRRTYKLCKDVFKEPLSVHVGHYSRSLNYSNKHQQIVEPVTQVAKEKDEK